MLFFAVEKNIVIKDKKRYLWNFPKITFFFIYKDLKMIRRIIQLAVFAILLLPLTLLAELRIGIIGDQTGSYDLPTSYEILQEGCQTISEYNPQLILHVGDLVESSVSDDEITKDFNQATGYLNNIKNGSKPVPWYITAGDHDVNPPNDYTPGTTNREKEKLFLKLLNEEYSKRTPKLNLDKLYYSFNFNGYHFICLYSEDNLRTDPRWGNIFMDKILNDQYNWLKQDLQRTSASKGIIVLIHQPMWYNWTGWKKIHNLLRQYSVMAVIAGHYHYNQDEGYLDGIRYVIVGSTGGMTKNGSENAGDLYHVTLLTLDNRNMNFELIPLKGFTNTEFTSRENMDRIQAVNTMITSVQYTSTATAEANPIDIPINIYSYSSNNQWSSLYNNVSPGTGVMISNLSSVDLDDGTRPTLNGMKVLFQDEKGESFWNYVIFNSETNSSSTKSTTATKPERKL